MRRQQEQKFRKLLKQHAPDIVLTLSKGGHYKLTLNNKLVATMSHSGDDTVIEECIKDLVRANLLPKELKRVRI